MIEPQSVATVLKVVSVSRFTPGMSSLLKQRFFFLLEFLSPFSGIDDPSSFTVVSPKKQFLPTLL